MAALIEIRAPTEDDDSWIPCASIQLAAEAIGVSVENLYRNLGPARADAPGDAALFNGFGVRRARRPRCGPRQRKARGARVRGRV